MAHAPVLDSETPDLATVTFLNPNRKGFGAEEETMAPTSTTPRPGQAVRGSTTGRPLMAALDLLGRRWSLRILWELRQGPLGARALRSRCDEMSSSVLYERLGELVQAGLIAQDDELGYGLTPLGHGLGRAIAPLDAWAERWSEALAPRHPMSSRHP
jgi:DNA-binding HxlR family transcriptional regulator